MNFQVSLWLYLAPVLIAGGACVLVFGYRNKLRRLRDFAAGRLLRQLHTGQCRQRSRLKHVLRLGGIALICVALARPQLGYTVTEVKSRGIDIVFALDASASMRAEDIAPNRLERAKLAIIDLLDRTQGDRIALVAFAGEASLECPLTLDYSAFRQALDVVSTDLLQTGGTDIAHALEEAEAAFLSNVNHKIVILVTDGEDLEADGIQRAETFGRQGLHVFTVGVGSSEGTRIPVRDRYGRTSNLRDQDGNVVTTTLDETTLKAIAQAGNGTYENLGVAGQGLERIYNNVATTLPAAELDLRKQRTPIERFQWPLVAAMLLLATEMLITNRRGGMRSVQALPTILVSSIIALTITSAEASNAQALKLYEEGKYEKAAIAFQTLLDNDSANVKINYNIGNALYKAGKLSEAKSAYTESLKANDIDIIAHALHNLGIISYDEAKAIEPELLEPTEELSAIERIIDVGDATLNAGWALVNNAKEASINTNNTEQSNDSQMQTMLIQQALQTIESLKNESNSYGVSRDTYEKHLTDALNYTNSAHELNKKNSSHKANYDYIRKLQDKFNNRLSADTLAKIEEHEAQLPALKEDLEALEEALNELLENQQQEDNNEQNEDSSEENEQESESSENSQENSSSEENESESSQNNNESSSQTEKPEQEQNQNSEQANAEESEQLDNDESEEVEQENENSGQTQTSGNNAEYTMSEEEAMQLLNSLSKFEQKLHLTKPSKSRSSGESGKPAKNW